MLTMKRGTTYLLLVIALLACGKKEIEQTEVPEQSPPPILRPVSMQVNQQIKGFYEAAPTSYNISSEQLPAMIFIHGAGQFGNGSNDLPMLLQEGITQLLDEKRIPGTFSVNGTSYSMIYFAPQFSSEFSIPALHEFIQYIRSNYRIDSTRIYVAGISRGAELACMYASEYPRSVTAIISMAGGLPEDSRELSAQSIASSSIPVWAIHNNDDPTCPVFYTNDYVSYINQSPAPAVPAKKND